MELKTFELNLQLKIQAPDKKTAKAMLSKEETLKQIIERILEESDDLLYDVNQETVAEDSWIN